MLSVSPSTTLTSVTGMPSSSATIWAKVVSWPWPCDLHAELEDRLAGRVDAQLGRVEHLQPGDVVGLRRPGADRLGEVGDADADEPPLGPRRRLLLAELLVADLVERRAQRGRVVAGVVDEAGRRLVRELLGLDEVLEAELGRVDAELVGRRLHEPLDEVRRLGDAERAPVGDAARRLVRERALAADVRRRVVVAAGHDVEQAGPELRRLGVGEEGALVGEHVDAERQDPALVRERQLALHVVVAGEAGGDEVLAAGLDPLHRLAEQQRRRGRHDVAGVDRHLVAEAAADVGADDADVLLRQPGHHGEQRADGVRRLRGHPDRRLAGRPS